MTADLKESCQKKHIDYKSTHSFAFLNHAPFNRIYRGLFSIYGTLKTLHGTAIKITRIMSMSRGVRSQSSQCYQSSSFLSWLDCYGNLHSAPPDPRGYAQSFRLNQLGIFNISLPFTLHHMYLCIHLFCFFSVSL